MSKVAESKIILMEHSKSKVELYREYLGTYLNILARSEYIDRINLLDLMCGEGVYENGGKGSPVVAIEEIKKHFFQNGKTCPHIELILNDNGISEIEPGVKRIERVQKACEGIFNHRNLKTIYRDYSYMDLYPRVLDKLNRMSNSERALLFIDPYGYSDVCPQHIWEFMKNGKTEIILFVPITYMYRFLKKTIGDEDFKGGRALKHFIEALAPIEMFEKCLSDRHFVELVKEKFKVLMPGKFASTFTIERDKSNIFALFFFSSHILGYEKMLETKWKFDEDRGQGYKINGQSSLFEPLDLSDFPSKLKNYIREKDRTNNDIFEFGLKEGFLARHTNDVLRFLQKEGLLVVKRTDGKKTRKGAFYLKDKSINVIFSLM